MSAARLMLDGIACRRGDRLLFEGLSLTLGAGEAMIVSGVNGAGKSSLLRLIAGLLAPATGRIAREGALALVGEAHALDTGLSVERALGFWAGIDGAGDGAVRDALAAMSIAHLEIGRAHV